MNLKDIKKEMSELPEEERKKKLEEIISKLSPEQLEELKKQECIFCNIAFKKLKSYIIHEDEEFIAVLDVMPANLGHILLFPKQHTTSLQNLNDKIFSIAKNIAIVITKLTGNVNIILQSGILAGQKSEHLTIHIIPRTKDDNININWQGLKISEESLEQIKEKITSNLSKEENLEGYLQKGRLP